MNNCQRLFGNVCTLLLTGFLGIGISNAQESDASGTRYETNWDSLDKRPLPKWWSDAKFGIFIHWGPYSVPAFSKVGHYSEWYWMNLVNPKRKNNGHALTKEFHERVYGKNFSYPDFVPEFKCEMFDADQWADIFQRSGARYVVLTSKHHDGYCLWPSAEANRSWGRPWSSTNSGPGRDLLGELTTAVRKKKDLHMGIYYSLYEWFNPLYVANPEVFVEKHLVPQFKDVVNKYAPEIIFSDGEWDHPYSFWKSTELLAWLYNESPSRDSVVVNDRWGKKTRHKHGGYYTTEYGAGLPDAKNPWEENRGMAHSFGYSRTENIDDYNSSRELLYMLIDIVSRGGNFLLDIGPTADGRIPVVMQERLLDIGQWLQVNGEAIYGSQPWTSTCQWSEGNIREAKHGRHSGKYDILRLTVSPKPGDAVKQILFTRKGENLYCICPQYPDEKLVVKDVKIKEDSAATLLGHGKPLACKQVGNNVEIEVPVLNPSKTPCNHAFVFKLSGVNTVGENEDEFTSIFNGKSLDGWDGDPRLWTIRDGVIHGETTPAAKANGNTFLVWQGRCTKGF